MATKRQSEQCIEDITRAAEKVCSETNKLRDAMIEQVKKQFERKYGSGEINDASDVDDDNSKDLPLYFEEGEVDIQKLHAMLGRLEAEDNDVKHIQLKKMSSFEIGNFPVDVLMSDSNGQAWICDATMKLSLVDKFGTSVNKKKMDHAPEAIALAENGDVYFTSYKDKMVRKFDKLGNVEYVLNTSPLHPVGLSITYDGDLLICVVDKFDFNAKKSNSKELLKVKLTGDRVTSVKFNVSNDELTAPYRVVENINGDVLVIDGLSENSGRLVAYSSTGEVKFTYNGGNGQTFCPTNVCIDYQGNIFILDGGSHCVHVLHSMGETQRILTTEEIGGKRPSIISIGRDGYFWVGHTDGEITVFRYRRVDPEVNE